MNKNNLAGAAAFCLVLSVLSQFTGCRTITADPNLSTDQYKQLVNQDQKDIQNAARIATRVYILTIDDARDRVKTGRFANDVSLAIANAIDKNEIQADGVRNFALDLIEKSNLKHKEAVGLLLDATTAVIEDKLESGQFLLLSGDKRAEAAKQLIKAAVNGILEATVTYSNPTTLPTMGTVTNGTR